ncbi:unnamed protein product [Arctia plantaginis]|uniref:PPIase cyclophilin-type domain-containing protein n=1 Tax=Arctia plantaginis TaxID=874455 RepID=A0A8S1BW75_ARCPL|nr:unnamed protein product [Arctia plantaginis]
MSFPGDTFQSKNIIVSMKPNKNGHNLYKRGHNSEENFKYKENDRKSLMEQDDRITFTVIGNRVNKEFIYCVTSVEWPKVRNDLKIKFGTLAHCVNAEVAVLLNGKFFGGENELKEFLESRRYVYHLSLDYYKEGIQQFANFINSQGLYADIVPLTCQNFLRLCKTTKGGYAGTPIHRIVKDNWIQCGGFNLKSNKDLNCENFLIRQDRRGVLCMANDGRHNDCSTQFFVLLQPAPWMDHKYVAFGQLIEGEGTLRKIENVPTWYESPKAEIIIYKAGIFDLTSKIPVNKDTTDYINGHIEDLNTIGEIFYKALIENVFIEINNKNSDPKITQDHPSLKDITENVRPAKRFVLTNEERDQNLLNADGTESPCTHESYETVVNYESDLQECEFEDYTCYKQITPLSIQSTEVKNKKQFYIPLTDVPYPGEVHSNFDLQRLLRGDYCLQNDLQKDPVQKQGHFNIPDEVFCAIFESYEDPDEEREYYLRLDDDAEIKKYIKKSVDKVSFAGPLVKKIASLNKKRELFDDLKQKINMAKKYNTAVPKYSEEKIHSESSPESSIPVSETKSNSSRRMSNLVHFDEETIYSYYDGSSSIFRLTRHVEQ